MSHRQSPSAFTVPLLFSLFLLGCASAGESGTRRGDDFYRGRSATISSAAYWKVTSCQKPADCGEPRPGSGWRCVNTSCLAVPAASAEEDAQASTIASHEVADEAAAAQSSEPVESRPSPPPPIGDPASFEPAPVTVPLPDLAPPPAPSLPPVTPTPGAEPPVAPAPLPAPSANPQ